MAETTRKYKDDGSYTDYDSSGRAVGGGIKGTENLATNGGIVMGSTSGKSSSGGSSRSKSLGNYNYTNQLEDLKQAQLTASMAALDKQKNASLSNLSAEKATIEPEYQKAKTQDNVTAKQTARSFDEYMAQRGGAKSGIAGQGTLLNNMAYQKQYGELDQAEKSALSDIARRQTDVSNSYASDVQAAKAGIEAQYLQNYITQMNADRAYNQQNYQFDKNYGLQSSTAAANNAMTYAQLNELQNPNSVTNQMKQIGLDTARLNYQALPDQLKAQAQKIAQDLAMGNISQQAAQLQLDYLPQQLQLGLAQTQAQINASNRAGTSSGKSIAQSSYQGKTNQDDALIAVQEQLANGNSPGNIARSIEEQRDSLKRQGINVDVLIKKVWESAGVITNPGEL